MPKHHDNFAILQEYFEKLTARSYQDGTQVARINYAVIGLVVLTHNAEKPLEIKEGFSKFSDILWFYKGEERFSLIFNYTTAELEVRKHGIHGDPLFSLNNTTPLPELIAVFTKL